MGRRFADILLMFEDAVPLGVRPASTGEVVLNPSDDYVYAAGGGGFFQLFNIYLLIY